MQALMNDQKKRREDKIRELQAFIQRFSSNKSKAKQATSRRKLLDQLTIEQMPASSRRYPWVSFTPDREAGKDILQVTGLNYTQDGVQLLKDVSFLVTKGQKIALVGNEQAQTALFRILAEEIQPDSGTVKWGVTISTSYFPKDNSKYFDGCDMTMMQWFAQYSPEQLETYMRGFLGRMLFSGDDVYKPVNVLSGGEKVRCMLSRMMLSGANFLMLDQPTNHLDLESITAVYVGKAVNLKNRVRSYFRDTVHTPKVDAMIAHIDDFEILLCETNLEALILECNLIKLHKPYYNILLKDDKHYPYLKVDMRQPFPRLELCRKLEQDGARYFGPGRRKGRGDLT